ncbi:MAG: quinone oxidoreductase [Pseudomonadota bacterium]
MPEAIVVREYGAAEVLVSERVAVSDPGPGELRIRQTAVGVNYHDVYVRSGLYKTLALPGTPGCEAAGVVDAVGEGVGDVAPGDRVAYVTPQYGAYASHRVLDAALAVPLPDGVSDVQAASNLLRAMTVDMLVHEVCTVLPEHTVLVHAAAGGVGRLLCQWLAHRGVRVIGTVGDPVKAVLATASGCAHTVLYREADVVEAVRDITDGAGVDIVFDSVGADTVAASLDALAPCGHLVNFGQSSGPVEPIALATLAAKSLTLSRPILFHYTAGPDRYQAMARAALAALEQGILTAAEARAFALHEAADAHALLESGHGGGATVLVP